MQTANLTLEETQNIFLLSLKELIPSLCRYSDKDLVKKFTAVKLQEAADLVFDFIDLSIKEPLSRNEYLALSKQVLKCLKTYLESANIPFTHNSVISHIHLLPFSVNRSFPGYASAGFLKSIIYPDNLSDYKATRATLVA